MATLDFTKELMGQFNKLATDEAKDKKKILRKELQEKSRDELSKVTMIYTKLSLQVITAEGEHKASRALRHAADVLAENPLAVQLRYLQSLEAIAEVNNSTIIFPVPVDVLSRLIPPVPSPAPTHQE